MSKDSTKRKYVPQTSVYLSVSDSASEIPLPALLLCRMHAGHEHRSDFLLSAPVLYPDGSVPSCTMEYMQALRQIQPLPVPGFPRQTPMPPSHQW